MGDLLGSSFVMHVLKFLARRLGQERSTAAVYQGLQTLRPRIIAGHERMKIMSIPLLGLENTKTISLFKFRSCVIS